MALVAQWPIRYYFAPIWSILQEAFGEKEESVNGSPKVLCFTSKKH